jgi:hypothetical protein
MLKIYLFKPDRKAIAPFPGEILNFTFDQAHRHKLYLEKSLFVYVLMPWRLILVR